MRFSKPSARFWRYYGARKVSDSLTGLKTMADLKLELAMNNRQKHSLILFDIDNFRRVNNAYGFDVGDEVIKQIANILLSVVKCCGEFYHLMGDEFAALIPDGHDAIGMAQSAVALLQDSRVHLGVIELRLTVSVGIADGFGINLLKKATMALLDARRNVGGKIQLYRQGSQTEIDIENNFKWQNKLKEACEEGRFIPFFQPILNLKNGKIEKYECLIRIQGENEIIEPMAFIGSAKESGFLSIITRAVMAQSFLAFKDNDYSFSVNITEDDLQDDSFAPFVKHKLELYNIDPSRVYFEILEGIVTDTVSEFIDSLKALKALGCKLSVDDFGVGHSNFNRMLELDIDIIKIDGNFIKNIDKDVTSRKIVSAIVNFAKAIDAKVIAEFVSSKEIYDTVKQMDVDYAQGFYIGAPNPEFIGS